MAKRAKEAKEKPYEMPAELCLKYVRFTTLGESKSGKTKIWLVQNAKSGCPLGHIQWRGGWRAYVFHPANDTIFDTKCLSEIAAMLAAATLAKKLKAGTSSATTQWIETNADHDT